MGTEGDSRLGGAFSGFDEEALADLWFALDHTAALYPTPFSWHAHAVFDELSRRVSGDLSEYLLKRRQHYGESPDQRHAPKV